MDSPTSAWVPFVLGLLAAAGLAVPPLVRLAALLGRTRRRLAPVEERLAALEREHVAVQEDLRFLTQFLRDYPRLARELYSGLGERQIPGVLLSIIQRSLDPQQVVVLVRRPDAGPARARLVVVAAHPANGPVRLGTEVAFDSGEIGFAAETQLVVTRQDLEAETARVRIRPGPLLEGLARPDLIAPLVFDQETLGVVLVHGARRAGDPTAALRLVAQTGAQVLYTAAQVRSMKTTAEMDGLTRVYNKRHLEQRLNELIYRAACTAYDRRTSGSEPSQSLAVFLFDIDHFKNYNDTNGHLAGDRLLQELARMVNDSVRKGDVFGRFGGEEFLLIQPGADAAQAVALAEKIRNLVAEHPFTDGDRQPLGRISISGGVAAYPVHGLDAAALLRAADEALYEAKRAGRNLVRMAGAAAPPPERRA